MPNIFSGCMVAERHKITGRELRPERNLVEHRWDNEKIFFDGDSYFACLFKDLSAAEHSVDLETYIYENDKLGRRLAQALMACASRGVRVRVLVDGIGSPAFAAAYMKDFEASGVQVKVYHPPPWRFSLLIEKASTYSKIKTLFKWINRRNHRKTCVIDHKIAWLGSINVSASHLREFSGENFWRDTGVRLEGAQIKELVKGFLQAWTDEHLWKRYHLTFKMPPRGWAKNSLIRLNNRWVERRLLQRNLMSRIAHASQHIWITNPYFVPPRKVIKALCWAALRKADVKLILPRKSDVFFIPWITSGLYYSLLSAGVRVFEYEPRILHSKTVIIDDWVTVGSSNFNHRSLLHDLEVDAVITWPDSRRELKEQFHRDLAECSEVNLQNWNRRPFFQRFAGEVLFLLKYWF